MLMAYKFLFFFLKTFHMTHIFRMLSRFDLEKFYNCFRVSLLLTDSNYITKYVKRIILCWNAFLNALWVFGKLFYIQFQFQIFYRWPHYSNIFLMKLKRYQIIFRKYLSSNFFYLKFWLIK